MLNTLNINDDAWAEIQNLKEGAFHPLTAFMSEGEYRSVVDHFHLPNGSVWTLPVTLDIPYDLIHQNRVNLNYQNEHIGELEITNVFKVDLNTDLVKIFGTNEDRHPGVSKEKNRSPWRVTGEIKIRKSFTPSFPNFYLTPTQSKTMIQKKGWKKIVGFQTRNPLHRAHEYLQRVALEIGDGLIIQPLVGWKRVGDFTAEAVMSAYQVMVENFYPQERVVLCTLTTSMRYAGPREAVFHALIRKNYGCTHFIVGRDHAGVGNFYHKYQAQDFAKSFSNLGIKILGLRGPYFCGRCGHVVTENSCPHGQQFEESISGTQVREMFNEGKRPPHYYMRAEISEKLAQMSQEGRLFY